MESTGTETKDNGDDEILTVPISFGNPSNEIIHGDLRLSTLEKHSQTFIEDLRGRPFTARLSTDRCSIYYLIHSIIIINKQIVSNPVPSKVSKQEADDDDTDDNDDADDDAVDGNNGLQTKHETQSKMHFPPTRITTAHLLKQKSNGSVHRNEEDEANCAFCFDSVEPPFTAHCSPKHKGYPSNPSFTKSPGPKSFKLFPTVHREEEEDNDIDDDNENENRSRSPLEAKWYDGEDAVCFVLCGHFFHVMCLMRCEQNSCPICRHFLFPESSSVCNSCNLCTKDLWVCLTCGHVGCGRMSNQCALRHFKVANHVWAKNLTTSHVWDYGDDDYVYRILMAEMMEGGAPKMVAMHTMNDGIDGSTKRLPQELDVMSSVKQEELVYEYNFVVQDRLKRMQCFHQSKRRRTLRNARNELSVMDKEMEDIQREIDRKRKGNELMLTQCEEKWNGINGVHGLGSRSNDEMEFIDDLEFLRKQLEEERVRGDKLKRMSHNVFKEQKTFNEKLKEYERSLKQSLLMTERTLNAEINNLSNELRDYQAHIDTAAKVKKAATKTELNSAEVSVKAGKSKNNAKKGRFQSNKKSKKSRKNRK